MQKKGFPETIDELVEKDPRYDREAYFFLRGALEFTVKTLHGGEGGKGGAHVSAGQLLEGVRDFALKEYGPMTRMVLEYWGVRESMDIGYLVFNLVGSGVFGRNDTDRLEDFAGGLDFEEAFTSPFRPARITPPPGVPDEPAEKSV